MPELEICGQALSLEEIEGVARGDLHLTLADSARRRIEASRAVVERALREGRIVYGVNTGFGRLAGVRIPASELNQLQLNLVRSHACGLGHPLSEAETRAMMLLRANTLALGFSGVRPALVEHLIAMSERRVHPVIPEKGSVGASGDLAPLAHLALAMIGEGAVIYNGQRLDSGEALAHAGLQPIVLEAKEGLALLNGTQAMAAAGGLALIRAIRLTGLADLAGAMTLEALRGTPAPFDERIQAVRPHGGQQAAAAHLRALMQESEIRRSHEVNDPRVQDAYSLRCMPQIHGAVRDALGHARRVLEIESGSATDNPLVFADSADVLSGGNFHGAPLALGLDYAGLAMTSLSCVSERRIARLVNPDLNEGLPPFLCSHPGVSSGFMLAHVAAVALLNESKILAHPASADNLPTSGGQEDHVSMGMTAALKLRGIVDNAEYIFAIEMLAAAEGIEYRAPLRPARRIARALEAVRSLAARLERDRSLAPDIERVAEAIRAGVFNEWTAEPSAS
ncbi:MAG: histidine ammonia-lyase [Terriglobia bacterium]